MNLVSGLYKRLYWPICRTYVRYFMGNKPADTIYRFLCSLHFWKVHRYWPQFTNPHTYSEKVWYRMLYDRNPQWTMFSDKRRVRDYVARKVGSEYLIPLLWSGDKPEQITFDRLPSKFVMKATHGCKYNIIVKDKTQLNHRNSRRQLKKWIGENYCQDCFLGVEWAYKNIRPSIIVESFLEDDGSVPVDYKFYCFSGRVEYLQLDFERFKKHKKLVFDRDFNPLDIIIGAERYRGRVVRPDNYDDMVRVAESLSRGLDFIRVDLYTVSGRIYFGELTCYPGGGDLRFIPREYDYEFGKKWKIN